MRGQILGVDARTGEALVAGGDGRRYRFAQADWAHPGEPAVGIDVDFDAQGDRALSVFPMPGAVALAPSVPPRTVVVANDRNKFVAAALAFVFGTLGIHRFYLGRTGSGLLMLVLSITVIGLLISGPWALVDTIRYLMMSERDFAGRYPRRDR